MQKLKKGRAKTILEAKKNLRLVMIESVITAGLLSIPIMTPFFHSVGLNQEQIAITQIIFTAVIMIVGFPVGWIVDRFSRKMANILGNLGCAITMIAYAFVQDFAGIVICEALFGIFLAFSQGVDSSLIKHFTGKIDKSEKLFKTTSAKVATWQQGFNMVLMLLGGPIGAISFRLAIGLSAITYVVGAIVASFVKDDSEKLVPVHKNPFKDMARVVKSTVKNSKLRLRIFAFAVAREITHGIIWVFTPLMLLAGVPLALVSIGWVLNSLAGVVGTKLAEKYIHRLKEWQILALPMLATVVGLGVMSIHFSIWTIWLYAVMGAVQGWTSATMLPIVQNHAKPSEQNSVVAFARVVARLLFIPSSWIIGVVADIKLEYSMLATLLIFIPLSVPILIKLRREN